MSVDVGPSPADTKATSSSGLPPVVTRPHCSEAQPVETSASASKEKELGSARMMQRRLTDHELSGTRLRCCRALRANSPPACPLERIVRRRGNHSHNKVHHFRAAAAATYPRDCRATTGEAEARMLNGRTTEFEEVFSAAPATSDLVRSKRSAGRPRRAKADVPSRSHLSNRRGRRCTPCQRNNNVAFWWPRETAERTNAVTAQQRGTGLDRRLTNHELSGRRAQRGCPLERKVRRLATDFGDLGSCQH
jgi:hypothetical protein